MNTFLPTLQFQTGLQNLMQGGQHAHGHMNPVAGVGLPSMDNPNQPGFMAGSMGGAAVAGGAISAPFGGTLGTPGVAGGSGPEDPRRARNRVRETPGMGMMPPLPFGGYRRLGGPVSPGVAYIGGEDGPELFVPRVPGFIVPNDALSTRGPKPGSRMGGLLSDRGPAGAQSGPLSSRGPVPMGGGMTPARRMKIAERRLASQGDVVGAARMADSRQWAERMSPVAGLPQVPTSVPGARVPGPQPLPPSGKLVPGSSSGSMVWQPDASAPVAATDSDGFQLPLTPAGEARRGLPLTGVDEDGFPLPLTEAGKSARSLPAGGNAIPPSTEDSRPMGPSPIDHGRFPLSPMLLPKEQMDAMRVSGLPMIPGMYAEAPPRFVEHKAGGMNMIVDNTTGKYVNSYTPESAPVPGWMNQPGTNLLMPTLGGKPNPALGMFQATPNPGWGARADSAGQRMPQARIEPLAKEKPAGPPPTKTFKRGFEDVDMQWNAELQGWEPVKFLDANKDGIDDRTQHPPGAGGAAAPVQGSGQTKAGTPFRLSGQVPAANHSSPAALSEEQQSLANARFLYQTSGYADDTPLREHFAKFPGSGAKAYAEQQQTRMVAQDAQRAQSARANEMEAAANRARADRQGLLPKLAAGAAKTPEALAQAGSALAGGVKAAEQAAKSAAIKGTIAAANIGLNVARGARNVFMGNPAKSPEELEWEEFQRWKQSQKK